MIAMFNGQPIFGPRGPAGPDGNPIGTVISYMGTTAPEDYLVCDGSIHNISDYSQLSTFFKEQFGTTNHFGGDGITTFAVPDLRNMFLRGFHGDSEEQLSAEIGEKQNPTRHIGFYVMNSDGHMYLPKSGTAPSVISSDFDKIISTGDKGYASYSPATNSSSVLDAISLFTSRPINTAVLYCIKAVTSSGTENVYSTEEQIVGQWIDGKPVYRLCFTMISNSQTNTITSYNLSQYHIKYVCSLRGILYSSEYYVTVPYIFDNQQINLIYHETDGCVYEKHNNDSHSSSPMTVVIEYTKTTD